MIAFTACMCLLGSPALADTFHVEVTLDEPVDFLHGLPSSFTFDYTTSFPDVYWPWSAITTPLTAAPLTGITWYLPCEAVKCSAWDSVMFHNNPNTPSGFEVETWYFDEAGGEWWLFLQTLHTVMTPGTYSLPGITVDSNSGVAYSLDGSIKVTDLASDIPETTSLVLFGTAAGLLIVGPAVFRKSRGSHLLDRV
jgi:hypothetical protein